MEQQTVVNKSVFVTGATGFLGSNIVCELLKEGRKVGVSYRNKDSLKKLDSKLATQNINAQYDSYELDLECREEVVEVLKGYDVVINAAADVDMTSNKKDYILKNVYLTRSVVWSAVKADIKRFIHISSIATLGSVRENEFVIDEKCELVSLNGKSGYSKSKFYSENEVFRAFYTGLNGVIINPSVIIGYDRNSKSSARIIELLSKKSYYYSDAVTGYVGVSDVAKIAVKMVDSDIVGERFIVSSENLSYKELMTMSAKSLGLLPPTKQLPVSLLKYIKGVIRFLESIGVHIGISSSMVGCLISKKYYNGEKISTVLKFKYTPIAESIDEALKEYQSTL